MILSFGDINDRTGDATGVETVAEVS